MGYRIIYGPVNNTTSRRGHAGRLRSMIAAALLAFTMLVRLYWHDGTIIMKEYLLPQHLTVTERAFSELIIDLREGQTVTDALTVFCLSILDETS